MLILIRAALCSNAAARAMQQGANVRAAAALTRTCSETWEQGRRLVGCVQPATWGAGED